MSVVIGVRFPKELKEELERLGIDYTEEVRRFLEEIIKRKRAEETIKALKRFRESIGKVEGNVAAEIVRKGRESR